MPLLSYCLAGLALASSLFLLAAGLTLNFGANRSFNVSHGSLAMLGAYVAWSVLSRLPHDPASVILGTLVTAGIIALLGAAIDILFGRRSQSLQLLATLGVLLVIRDVTPLVWDHEPVFYANPIDDLILIAVGPATLAVLLLILHRTHWGSRVRAATLEAETPRWLITSVAALAAGLAGLAGALTLNSAPVTPGLDLAFLTDAIVVAIIGGLGSVTGAFLAALLIGQLQAFGAALLPQLSPFLAVAVMAAVLIIRPNGFLGRPHIETPAEAILIRPTPLSIRLLFAGGLLAAIAAPVLADPDTLSVLIEILIAILFAASLHLMMGPGGMPSLGHAAFFGIGAYAAAILVRETGADMSLALIAAPLAAGLAAFLVGAIIVRLPGIPLAMLTLVFAQTLWTLAVQAGDREIIQPAPWATPPILYWLTLALCIGATLLLRRILAAPFGHALRATRDDPARAAASGLPAYLLRLSAFTLAGATAGLAGGLAAFSVGSASPADLSIVKSAEALLMVLLGGLQTLSGPIVGALAATAFRNAALQATIAWHLVLGLALIALVLLFPLGIAGASIRAWRRAP